MFVVAKRLDGLGCHLVWCRPRPRRLCVTWGPTHPRKKGTAPAQFSAHVYCGQTAGWIKVPLGTEVNLGSGDVVLDGVPAPSPCLLWPKAGWTKSSLGTEVDLGPGHIVLDVDPAPPPCERGTAAPSFRPMSIVATVAHLSGLQQ